MTNTRTSLNQSTRKKVLERDNHRCIKCGRDSKLEIHHIIPVYRNGTDHSFNLITLCKGCHRLAPDEPFEFIKFCSQHLPPDLERSKTLTKSFTLFVINDKDFIFILLENSAKSESSINIPLNLQVSLGNSCCEKI